MPAVGIDELLDAARSGLVRVHPTQVMDALDQGAILVDTRTESQRREQGELPRAIVIDRTVLEWRLDPSSPSRIRELTSADQTVIVVCRQGYSSSLAAHSLQQMGLSGATDMIGGVDEWLRCGLPMEDGEADVRR